MQPPASLQEENDSINESIIPLLVVAVAVSPESSDTMWFIRVEEIDCINLKDDVVNYGHVIPAGMTYIKGNFLERMKSNKHSSTFKISKKCKFFHKESVVYPYVELLANKKGFVLENRTMTEILCHVDENKFQYI